MEILKTLLVCFLNFIILGIVVGGVGLLAVLTGLRIIFCWNSSIETYIIDMYDAVSSTIKDYI